jgi:hypothetical protein
VPEALVRFPLPAGKKLTSVAVNGQPVSSFTADSVTLKSIAAATTIEAHF